MVLKHRALLELMVRIMIAPATHWNAFYSELWEPALVELMGRSVLQDQRSPLQSYYALPKFVLLMYAAGDLLEDGFELCYEFLTIPSAQVLSSSQRELLNRVNENGRPEQIVLELTSQLFGCEMTNELLAGLQRLLERLEATDQTDPIAFPFRFKITTLWLGISVDPTLDHMDLVMDLTGRPHVCALDALNIEPSEPYYLSLEDFVPRVVLDLATRRIDFRWLTLTVLLVSRICSALRVTDHVQELAIAKHANYDPSQAETWAWIAFGILHRDSCSTVKQLELNHLEGSAESMEIVARILASPHPGKELLTVLAPEYNDVIQSEAVPLPRGTRVFVSLNADFELKQTPDPDSAATLARLSVTITSEMQWEVLDELSSGWTSILVPAYGIAWVSTDSIITKHEQTSAIDPDDTTARSNASLKVLVGVYYRVVERLLPMIGHSLESLGVMSANVISICDNCPSLKHLEIRSTDSSTVHLILSAYQRGQCRVEWLKLDDDTRHGKGYVNEVALLLRDPSAKDLERLRIYFRHGDMDALDDLIEACHSNQRLEVLDVLPIDLNDDHQNILQRKLNVLNNNLLAIQTPDEVKLAFLSVVEYHRNTLACADMEHFDSRVIARILQFAGSPIRRKVSLLVV